MAEEKKIATGYIGNALRSAADNHTTTFADEIFDTERQKYQNEVTADLETTDNEIKADLEAETARAKAAEEANTLAITDEVARLDTTDTEIKTDLEAEAARAKAAEEANTLAISNEAQARAEDDEELEKQNLFLSENTLSIVSDYIVNKDGLNESTRDSIEINVTDNAYYDKKGNVINNDNYVCGGFEISDDAYKFVSIKFSCPLNYVAKSFFSNSEGTILQYIGNTGIEVNYIIPKGATKVFISSRKTADTFVVGNPQPTYKLNNIQISPFARESDIETETARAKAAEEANTLAITDEVARLDTTDTEIKTEIYKREVAINNAPSDIYHKIDIEIHDNKYFDINFIEQDSANFNCFKCDVSSYRNRYILLEAYCFGSAYAAISAITSENNKIIRFVSNEGILPKYIFIPRDAKYLYVSNRKYNDVRFSVTDSIVKSVSIPKLYNVYSTPTLLDTRHFTLIERKNYNKYFHFSLDDFKDAIADIVTNANTYNSIFDNSTFAKLREWHEKYGIVISLYLQRTMADVPGKFKNDFIFNSNWMKLGYHGTGTSWETATYENGKQWWNDFVSGIMTSIGDYSVIDRVPRNDYFHGTLESCKGERDANCGCIGFLGCDDWSYNAEKRGTNYYLTSEQNTYLDARDRYYDYENQLCIFKTDFRLEQITQRWGTVEECLNFYKSAEAAMQAFDLIVFSHEWNFMSYETQAETIFKWALKNRYRFDFPMNTLLK